MLYEWRKGEETQLHAVPGYIYLVLVLGSAASVSNAMSYMGACSRSVCLLSASLCLVFVVLLLEAVLALILFYDPALVDNKVCPPDDAACLARIDNLFKDPSAHAGPTLSPPCRHPTSSAPVTLASVLAVPALCQPCALRPCIACHRAVHLAISLSCAVVRQTASFSCIRVCVCACICLHPTQLALARDV